MDNDPDRLLAVILQDIINNAPHFEPVGGNLRLYQGEVGYTKDGTPIIIQIEIGYDYPHNPPVIKSLVPIQHPIVSHDQKIYPPSLSKWNPNYSISRLIREIQQEFSRNRPLKITSTTSQSQVVQNYLQPLNQHELMEIDTLKAEVSSLQNELHQIEHQIQQEKEKIMKKHSSLSTPISGEDELLAEKRAIEKFLETFEEYYEDALISPADFYRFYRVYLKELFILNQKLSPQNSDRKEKEVKKTNVSPRTRERRLA